MAKADKFYKTQAWKKCREAYMKSVGGLCERCLAKGMITPGEIVHHKVHLDTENVNDTEISLDFNNLELLCRQCHAEQHPEIYNKRGKRYKVDALGRVILPD